MSKLRSSSKRTADPKKMVVGKTDQRIFYGTLAILGTVALVVVVILMLRPSTTANQAQTQPGLGVQEVLPTFPTPPPVVAYSAEAEALFASLNCLCGTCKDTLAECDCGEARQIKGYVDSLTDTSSSESEVIDKVVEKYGPGVLVSTE